MNKAVSLRIVRGCFKKKPQFDRSSSRARGVFMTFSRLFIIFCLSAIAVSAQTPTNGLVSLVLPLPDYLKELRESSPDVRLARHDMGTAAANYHELRDAFSPSLSASVAGGLPTSATYVLSNLGYSVGVSKVFSETGTVLAASWTNGWFFQSAPAPVSFSLGGPPMSFSLIPAVNQYSTALSFTVSQSLLRGAPWASAGRDALEAMRQLVRLQRSVYNSRVGGLVMAGLQTYYNLDLQNKFLTIANESIADATDLLEKNRRRVELGTVDISDVYRSEVNLTFAQNSRDEIQKNIFNGQTQILYLTGRTNLDPHDVSLKVDSLVFREESLTEEQMLETAFRNRKDLEQARIQTEMARLDYHSARVSQLPKLDAFATLNIAGYDTNGNYASAVSNLGVGSTNIGWFVGLRFEAPLDPRAYGTVVEKRKIAYEKARETEDQLRRQVRVSIHNHMANLRYLKDVLDRTREALDISDKKVAELRRQFNNARINSFFYIQGYEELRNVQKIYHSSLMAWELEKASLKMDMGQLLKYYKLPETDAAAPVR
jgi:outer membrane protein TolC